MKIKVRDGEGENVEFNLFSGCGLGCLGFFVMTGLIIAALILK